METPFSTYAVLHIFVLVLPNLINIGAYCKFKPLEFAVLKTQLRSFLWLFIDDQMHKYLILLFISLFSRNVVFSQSIAIDTVKENDSLKKTAVFKKKDLPYNQKVSPEIFYIVNDKPVSREEYLKQKIKKQ